MIRGRPFDRFIFNFKVSVVGLIIALIQIRLTSIQKGFKESSYFFDLRRDNLWFRL